MSDEALGAIIDHSAVELFEVRDGDAVVGMLELDRREAARMRACLPRPHSRLHRSRPRQLAVRRSAGRAWQDGTTRVHVHTCSLDHPAALAAYRRAGFTPVARKVETFPDPRLAGILPRDSAPHIPLLDPSPI